MSIFKHLYVENIVDVVGDINCEFRVIVALLGKGVELWSTILHDLIRKLNMNHKDYVELYVSKERGKELIDSLWPMKCVEHAPSSCSGCVLPEIISIVQKYNYRHKESCYLLSSFLEGL